MLSPAMSTSANTPAQTCQPWTCPTCRTSTTTPFCPGCGEHPLRPAEHTLSGLAITVVKAFSNIDGKVLRSVRDLLLRPGALTSAFQHGIRKPFIGPIASFLVANVLFFALQAFTTFRVFSTTLDMHLHNQPWSEFAQVLVTARLKEMGTSLELYRPVFDQAVIVNAKSLIGLMVLPLAVLVSAVFVRARQPLAVHIVFALHFYAFLVVLFCLPVAAMVIEPWLGGDGKMSQTVDDAMSVILVLTCALYLYVAIKPVYAVQGVMRIAQTAVLAVAVAGIFLAYRFVLLLITLYTT